MTVNIKWTPSPKQRQALKVLNDSTTNEILYGGGAGGGKSHLGCAWLLINSLNYPGSRWLMGRAFLKSIKESTLLTFFRICKDWGLKRNIDYKYNSIEGTIKFLISGSEIYLRDLFLYPSDPEFDELGSTEYTGAFIDEASQITQKAYNIVMSRIRYKLDEFKIIPKLLTATNPTKSFLYYEFYRPWKENKLLPYRKFIPALVQDNPYISKHYIENLGKLDDISKERLLKGNWEYDEDLSRLFEYDRIVDMFKISPIEFVPKYLTIDVARYGDDKTVIYLWEGLYIKKIYCYVHNNNRETRLIIERIMLELNIPKQNVIVDEDGIGGGIVDEMPGIRGFVNGSKPFEKPVKQGQTQIHNYQNLKSQCYYLLAEYVNSGRIGIYEGVDINIKKLIIEDLEQIKRKDPDKDGKLAVTPKEEIKEILGRSTDFGDAMMMRMFFEVKGQSRPYMSMR